MQNNKKLAALGLPPLAASLHDACSQNQETVTDEWSDSSKYLPGADEEGQEDDDECVSTSIEKVYSQSWLGSFCITYSQCFNI